MNQKYNVYLVSDSTGETLDRIFLSLKSQFSNFDYEKKEFAFVRTEQQIDKIIKECVELDNSLILYTIVETKLAKYIANQSEKKNIHEKSRNERITAKQEFHQGFEGI